MNPQAVTTLVFFGVLGAIAAPYLFHIARQSRQRSSLARRLGTTERDTTLLKEGEGPDTTPLGMLLTESGLGWTTTNFIQRTLLMGAGGTLLGGLLAGPPLAFLFGIVGFAITPIALRRARSQRMEQCNQQMPQALEIMSLALRAGHPLPRALAIAAGEAPAPISDELRRVVEEHDLGRPIGEVLLEMGKRLEGCEAVNTFVVAVLVLEQTGGNLIQVIERIVDNARSRAQFQSRVRALTSQGRSSARMLGMLPLAFGVLAGLMDPEYFKVLLGDPRGNIVLLITFCLWGVGLMWTRKLVNTEV